MLRPRKSIFRRPTRSISFIAHCVTISSRSPLVERRVLGDRPRRDDHAGGVHRGVARHAFEAPGDGEQLLDLRIVLLHLLERRVLLERLVERHVERRRDLLGDLVDVGVRHLEDARPTSRTTALRLHRPERDDLRDVLAAVLARDVLDHLAAAPLAEVDVDVGQRHALGVEEALEDQVVLDRIDVGDPQAVGDEAAGRRSAAGADRNALLARVADEVPDDQEVPGYFIFLIIVDLVRRAGARTRRSCAAATPARRELPAAAAAAARTLRATMCSKYSSSVKPVGHVEVRQVVRPCRQIDVAALGDAQRVGERVGKSLKTAAISSAVFRKNCSPW